MVIVRIILLVLLVTSARCSTHWVVTEEGKLQEQLESPFAINQPHNLMAFMKQETNYEKMQEIKKILVVEKKEIEDNEDKELDLEEKHYENDEDCIAAGKQLTEYDLFVSSVLPLENKEIEVSAFIDFTDPDKDEIITSPDCANIVKLPSLSSKYDSLQGVMERKNLRLYTAEPGIASTLKYMGSIEELGNAIDSALVKNSSSWVAYNLAAMYWRMKGDAEKAIECIRRALFYSPHEYKDVALVSLANILHRSHYSLNASVVLEEALKISDKSVIHFALGSIYAILGEFLLSVEHYEKTLEEQPEFVAAKKRLNAVKCQRKLQLKLEAQHESLQRTLRELEAYQEKHKKYVEIYQAIEKMQLSRQEQINMHFLLMQYMIKEGNFDHKLCKFRSDDGGPVMFCNLPRPSSDEQEKDVELIPNINSGGKDGNFMQKDVRGHVPDAKSTSFAAGDDAGFFQQPEQIEKIEVGDWRDPDWPPEDLCTKHAPRNLAWDEFPSTYIDPETRGFPVRELLTSYIGIKEGENVPQPWSELNCESLEPVCEQTALDNIRAVIDRHSGPLHKQDLFVKRELLLHLNEGRVWPGDFAHRINTAIKKSLSDKDKDKNLWVLYNIAGLYFRVHGDNLKAIECIRRGMHYTPKEHSDIPMVNMANIMYRLGKINDALSLSVDALGINRTEPMTYLTVGNVLQAKGNVTGSIPFYQYGQYLNQQFQANFWAMLNVKCAAMRDEALNARMEGNKEKEEAKDHSVACGEGDTPCNNPSVLMDNIRNAKDPGGHVFKTEETPTGMKMYTVHAFTSEETRVTTECENASDETDLVRRLESTKEDADKILHDADAVIQRLSHVAKDSAEELSMRVSSARKIMQQLSQMRESLGSLVEEASSTLDYSNPVKKKPFKEQFSQSECVHALHNIDLRSYLSSNMDVGARGYNFGEELSPAVARTSTKDPFCVAPTTSQQYNVDNLETVKKSLSAAAMLYDEEYGMELLLKQLIPLDSGSQDFTILVNQLVEGMERHPTSWRLSYLSSYYWRMKGRAKEAIDCLRLSLSTAPLEMRDVVLLGLSNVFAGLSEWDDAIHVTEQALLLYPDYFLYHFTMANILAAKGDVWRSIPYFKRALELQPEVEIAQRRYEAAVCEIQRAGIH